MKIRIPQIVFAAIAVSGLTAASLSAADKPAAASGESKATFKVTGMMCSACESKVKNAVTKVDGVKSIEANSDKGTAVVAYDPTKTSEDKIASAINSTSFKVAK